MVGVETNRGRYRQREGADGEKKETNTHREGDINREKGQMERKKKQRYTHRGIDTQRSTRFWQLNREENNIRFIMDIFS